MNRKTFLSSVALATASINIIQGQEQKSYQAPAIIPPYLKPGDVIGITSPAGYITKEEIAPSVLQMESWGFKIKTGNTIGKRDFTFGGTDAERTIDLQQMLDDPSLKAIMCARGGYGSVRIIDKLDFTKFAANPKWLIGFSDITVLHSHLNRNFGIATIHSKMCNSFPDDWNKAEPIQIETILSIRQALNGNNKMSYTIPSGISNRRGTAEGELVGGNLKTIESLAGSKSDIKTDGKILFVEDTGEYLYSIDRMFINLKRTGKLSALKALLIGGFKIKQDDAGDEFGRTLYEIVLEKVKEYSYPVCFDFPVGHQRNNYAFKCGVKHRLEMNESNSTLKEI